MSSAAAPPSLPLPGRRGLLRRWLRRIVRALLALLIFIVLYIAAGFGLGAIQRNRDFRNTPGGTRIWITTNGMHTGIILPAVTEDADFPAEFRHPDAGSPVAPPYVLVGWGDREFFAHVPRWSALTPGLACGSILGTHRSALNLFWMKRVPMDGPMSYELSPEQYRRLTTFIFSAAERGPDGHPVPLAMPQTERDLKDVYYASPERYHLFRTCNVWTTEALHEAGVPCGVWTPFAPSVMGHGGKGN